MNPLRICPVVLFAVLSPFPAAAADTLQKAIEADYPRLEELYTHLHQNPELSFHEEKSAQRMAQELRDAGFEVTEGVGGYGVVGVMKNGKGPTLMIRADMDGLPVEEKSGVLYASKVKVRDALGNEVGVMHACGHDVHMTVFSGTARRLVEMKGQWKGTLVMIAQPAEERGSGARAMLRDGLFERFPRPDYNLGLHVNSQYPAGTITYTKGFAMANVDSVDLTVFGVGGHGAYPQNTRDPIVLSAQIINNLQTLVSRNIAAIDAGVVTVGSIHGGAKHNIIPDRVDLQITVRSYTDSTRQLLLDGIDRISQGQAMAAGIPADRMPVMKIGDEHTPALYNHPELLGLVADEFVRRFGAESVLVGEAVMGGEDFSEFGRVEPRIPNVFFNIGGVDPEVFAQAKASGATLPSNHSPLFAPLPEPTLRTGVEAMTVAALYLFRAAPKVKPAVF